MAVLSDLPPDAALCLLDHVVTTTNTGQLLQLATACHQWFDVVAHSDWFWQQQCASLGWVRPGVHHPPIAHLPQATQVTTHPTAQHDQEDEQQQQQQLPLAAAAAAQSAAAIQANRLWFDYYCLRMSCRWRLRLLVRKYVPFLNIQSRLAIQTGASIQQLEAAECVLGMKLPWELWELYRFRAGQAPGAGVCFADVCRLLGEAELEVVPCGVSELSVSSIPNLCRLSLAPGTPVSQQQQLAALEAQLPQLSCQHQHSRMLHTPSQPGAAASAAVLDGHGTANLPAQQQHRTLQRLQQQTGSCGHESTGRTARQGPVSATADGCGTETPAHDIPVVVFLANSMGSVEYVVAPDASVYLKRGFTARRVASNLTGFIQHLLA